VEFNQLDLEKHRKFILERFLNYGTFDTFKWIFKTFDNEEVKEFINKKGIHSLSRNSFYFWKKISSEKRLWKKS
jgi:oligoribonuclease NrnB/cAMP/cGMP phosphodiesterase (DHH superfamily)